MVAVHRTYRNVRLVPTGEITVTTAAKMEFHGEMLNETKRRGSASPEEKRSKLMAKRGNNEGSIYKREDGRWAATINLGWQDGKRRRKTFYAKTRREVQEHDDCERQQDKTSKGRED